MIRDGVRHIPCAESGCEREWGPVYENTTWAHNATLTHGWWADLAANYWCPEHRVNSTSYMLRNATEVPPTPKNPLPPVSREDVDGWLALAEERNKLNQAVYDDLKKRHEPFAGGGMREGHGDRARFELLLPRGVPFEEQLLTRCAVHMAKGAIKYSDRNWESFSDDEALQRAKSSALRHMMQWITGTNDGEDHAAAIVFNLMAAEHVAAKLDRAADAKAAAEMTETRKTYNERMTDSANSMRNRFRTEKP